MLVAGRSGWVPQGECGYDAETWARTFKSLNRELRAGAYRRIPSRELRSVRVVRILLLVPGAGIAEDCPRLCSASGSATAPDCLVFRGHGRQRTRLSGLEGRWPTRPVLPERPSTSTPGWYSAPHRTQTRPEALTPLAEFPISLL